MISKETFIDTLQVMQGQLLDNSVKAELLTEAFGVELINIPNGDVLATQIIKLLQLYFPPIDNFCEIEHFCFGCDFGNFDDCDYMDSGELYDKLLSESYALPCIIHFTDLSGKCFKCNEQVYSSNNN